MNQIRRRVPYLIEIRVCGFRLIEQESHTIRPTGVISTCPLPFWLNKTLSAPRSTPFCSSCGLNSLFYSLYFEFPSVGHNATLTSFSTSTTISLRLAKNTANFREIKISSLYNFKVLTNKYLMFNNILKWIQLYKINYYIFNR